MHSITSAKQHIFGETKKIYMLTIKNNIYHDRFEDLEETDSLITFARYCGRCVKGDA